MLALLAGAMMFGCRPPLPSSELRWRGDREKAVRAELTAADRAMFRGLRYYAYDASYKFRVILEPVAPPEPLTIAASDGVPRPAHRVARVRLNLPDGDATLAIYQLDDMLSEYPDSLFLPFRDANAGKETYGAGRYVEIERLPGGVVEIDFNRAYNPDCAYGIAGRCPVTPQENTLKIALRAGEMNPPGHS